MCTKDREVTNATMSQPVAPAMRGAPASHFEVLSPSQAIQHEPSNGRIEQALATADGADAADQVTTLDLLEHVTGRTSHD